MHDCLDADEWYDARLYGPQGMATSRVLPQDEAKGGDGPIPPSEVFRTTKMAAEEANAAAPPPAAVRKPRLVSARNMAATLAARVGTMEATAASSKFGSPLRGDNVTEENEKRYFATTTEFFYETKPARARALRGPEYFTMPVNPSRAGRIAAAAHARESTSTTMSTYASAGRSGSRGEMTRNPGEAGSVYGVSVFSDEYSKWGSALRGKPLGETISNMQTKYF